LEPWVPWHVSGYLSESDRPLLTSAEDEQPKKLEKKPVMLTPEFVDEALCACEEHLNNLAHLDIDRDLEAPLSLSPGGWSLFLQRYYQVVQ
jgi:tubulin monoglycylase TTLL3/8